MTYKLVAIGGTFDLLHNGHKGFLKFALNNSEKVILGLTSDSYVEKNKSTKKVASYASRKDALEDFLKEIEAQDRVEIIPLNDAFGPAINPGYSFDALFVTVETKNGGEALNKKRVELGLLPLPLEVFNLVKEGEERISSTMIRKKILLLPPTLRKLLQDPFGKILTDVPSPLDQNKTVTVGDATTKRFLDLQIQPFLVVIDHKVERKPFEELNLENRKILQVKNAASTITPELFDIARQVFNQGERAAIVVDGEEDLVVLPVVISAPLGFTVFYGQPHTGLVEVLVTEDVKQKAQEIIDRFEIV